MQEFIAIDEIRNDLSRLQQVRPDWIEDWIISRVEVEIGNKSLEVEMIIGAALGAVTPEKVEILQNYIRDNLNYPKNVEHFYLKVVVAPIKVFEVESYSNEVEMVEDDLNAQ